MRGAHENVYSHVSRAFTRLEGNAFGFDFCVFVFFFLEMMMI